MSDNVVFVIMGTLMIGLVAFALHANVEERKRWDAFRTTHECKIVSKIEGQTFTTYGVDSKGNTTRRTASTRAQTCWACNDGVTYCR